MPLALSTGHEVGLAVTGAAFIAFALASSFLFPRFRPQYPGGGLRAFIVVAFVFFFGMLAAVEPDSLEDELEKLPLCVPASRYPDGVCLSATSNSSTDAIVPAADWLRQSARSSAPDARSARSLGRPPRSA